MDAVIPESQGLPTANQLLVEAAVSLQAAGVGTPRLDAEVLLAAAWRVDRAALYARRRDVVPAPVRDTFAMMCRQRITREPLQYIIGRQELWSLDFVVTPDVLIPRPETELLIQVSIDLLASSVARPPTICDVGTGSGCIAVALARELPDAHIWALDASSTALRVAKLNAERQGVAERVRFLESDLFASVHRKLFDLIVSNPPYVGSDEMVCLQPEARCEPAYALDGGIEGLDVIKRLVPAAHDRLVPGGWLVMEIGAGQGVAVEALGRTAQFETVALRTDYSRLPRALVARR